MTVSILVVDDSSFQRRILQKYLTEAGYEVILANNGAEALHVLMQIQPLCVLLDLMMPVMGGLELIHEMQAEAFTTPVVILTADIQRTTYERCKAAGVYELLEKPVNKEQLLYVLDAIQAQHS